jgi:hypothetical protein
LDHDFKDNILIKKIENRLWCIDAMQDKMKEPDSYFFDNGKAVCLVW